MSSTIPPSTEAEKKGMPEKHTQDSEIQRVATQGTFPADEKHKNNSVKAGELTFEEDTAGGLGRHLGVFSTTFLDVRFQSHEAQDQRHTY